MKKPRKLLKMILVTAITSLAFGSIAQAQYQYNKKVTVDHTRVFGIPYGYSYMKKITIDSSRVGGTNTTPPAGFSAVKKITVNSAKVSGSSDLADFPVMVSISGDTGLKTTANGGQVTDSQGDDILFYDETLGSQLDHEIESYDGTTGTLVAWVRIPNLKAAENTVFYLAYGNGSIGSSQENPTGVWDSNFRGVWHLHDDVLDSTSNNNDSTNNGTTNATGQIADGQNFVAFERDYLQVSGLLGQPANITLSAWINFDMADANGGEIISLGDLVGLRADQDATDGLKGFYYQGFDWNDTNTGNLYAGTGWHHVVYFIDDTANSQKIYVDGQETASNTYTASISYSGLGTDTFIGRHGNGQTDIDFDGRIDEVRISNVARSADWIKTSYNNQSDPSGFMTIEDSSDHENFPVLISLTSDDLKNPGRVTNANGYDIIFMDSTLSGKLDHEVESYVGASGTLVAWVKVPLLKVAEDTVIYLCYGNGSISSPTENPAEVWDSNYKGVWHLDGTPGGGSDVADSTANAVHGTTNNMESTDQGAGKIGGSLDFDGTNEYIAVPDAASLDITAELTLEAWVKLTNAGDDQKIVGKTDLPQYGPLLGVLGGLRPEFWDSSHTNYSFNSGTISSNQWTHLAVTWKTNGNLIGYINGNQVNSISNGSQNLGTNNGNLVIGGAPWIPDTLNVDGIIDEVRISDTSRSADWIKTSYNNQQWPNKADWPTEGFITVTDALGTDLADFPVLVSIKNDPQLKTTANGGQVSDDNGYDIIFTSDSAGTNQLEHEVESYDGATGTLVVWVRLPVLKIDEDTDFYLYYGNSGISSPTENPAGVWDGNYMGVWHLQGTPGGTDDVSDSTANAVNGTTVNMDSSDQVAGQIGGSINFDGTDDKISLGTGTIIDGRSAFTIEAWVNPAASPGANTHFTVWSRSQDGNGALSLHVGEWGVQDTHILVATNNGAWHDHISDSQVSAQAWTHVTAVYDGSSAVSYYENGQSDGSDSYTPPASVASLAQAIGCVESGPADNFFNGKIDELRISNTNRSAPWIQTSYNNQRWPNKADWPSEGFITVERGVCQSAVPVACGSSTAGSIAAAGQWQSYAVTLADASSLKVYTTGDTDTYGHLYDGTCSEIDQNDKVDDNFYISRTVAAGTYYVQVRHASSTGTGAYTLQVECSDDDHGNKIEDATPLDCNSSVGGRIDSGGDEDYFKVVFWGTGKLTAYSSGSDDVEGALIDDGGNTIAADNDTAGGKQFQIVATVSPGLYYVVVKHHNVAGTGVYTLHVECEYTPVIIATAEYGGSISPEGAVGVSYDGSQSFTITPDTGNTIRDVWVDGVWVGALTSYQFTNVQADHKIVAVFNADFENCVDIPDTPLDAWYRSAPANVMFVLDDSGSMDWEFMTSDEDGTFDGGYRYVFDNPGDNLYTGVLPDSRRMRWKSQWAGYNRLYYDPAVDYQPWPNDANTAALTLDPADPDHPRSHPMHAGTTFDLNGTYYEFSGAADDIIIVDDEDSGFTKSSPGSGGGSFANTGAITIRDYNSASPYASTITVPDLGGTITELTVTISGLSHTYPQDIDMLLVGPGGQEVMLMSDQGGYRSIYGVNLTFDDDAAADLSNYRIYSGTYKPCEYTQSDWMPSPAPSGPYGTQLSVFDGTDPQGTWELYVKDDAGSSSGSISGGWSLNIATDGSGSGSWQEANPEGSQAYNGHYWWTSDDGGYTATWTPDIAVAGDYEVYAMWVADTNRSTAVTYTVHHAGGDTNVTVDQTQNGTGGVLLGTFNFNAGTSGYVTVSFTQSAGSGNFCADAIKFIVPGSSGLTAIKRAHYYVWSASAGKPYLVNMDGNLHYYAVSDANADDEIAESEIEAVSDNATLPDDVKPARSYAEERQNFANWYQYYRRRELSATAAVANVIAGLKGVQAGFYSINGNLVQPVLPVKTNGVDKSKLLLQALYDLDLRAQGTPLRRGLKEVGKYYSDSSNMIGSSPYAPAVDGGACQQSFTIVMTDGYWNGGSPDVGNDDGDDNSAFDGGAYADIYANTLADVAMQYYETDLNTGLDNTVPTNESDSATHQHMVTYAVSFGVLGSLNPADYDIAGGSYPVWPDPRYVDQHKIDDLWHAAVNGRGEFLNAANPTELVDSLLAISRSIDARIASSSSVSVNGDPLYEELGSTTRMYQATYRSDGWIGDVNSYQLDTDSGEVDATPDWSSGALLEARNWDTGRIIATYDGTAGIPFRYERTVLSADQQTALGSDLVADSAAEQNAVKILNYLRGDRSNEEQNGGAFRDRFQVLGDIVHSSPVYYNGVLYAGGNDGMLHAFDAADGEELFAYVPNLVFGHLNSLVDPDYSHKYFVDLSPTVQDITLSGQPKTYLVGGLGKGGKGYYALDVSTPADITDESKLAAKVLWEFPGAQSASKTSLAYDNKDPAFDMGMLVGKIIFNNGGLASATVVAVEELDATSGILELDQITGTFLDDDELYFAVKFAQADGTLYDAYMGYSYSRPVIAKSNDAGQAEWLVIFGNGYDSQKSHAVLYILNLATGQLIKRIDTGAGNCNGLSSPIAIDIDSNGTADYVYAGDLQGNLWKFDLQDADAANWTVAYKDPGGNPAPVFQAKNFSGHPQPITSKPDVMYHCGQHGYLVVFGTGRYLTEKDLESSESNTIYGVWDYGDDDDDSEYLGAFERAATPQLVNHHLDGVESRMRVELLQQTVEAGTWTTPDGQNLRVITDYSPVWGTVDDSDPDQLPDPGSNIDGDTVHAGWYFDLPNTGEMVVSDVMIRDGKVLVISFTPGRNPCGSGGTSIFHTLNACSGGRPNNNVFVNIDTVVHKPVSGAETTITITSDDWKEISGVEFTGRLQPPVILRHGDTEFNYLSSSSGDVYKQEAAGSHLGIFYWLQVE